MPNISITDRLSHRSVGRLFTKRGAHLCRSSFGLAIISIFTENLSLRDKVDQLTERPEHEQLFADRYVRITIKAVTGGDWTRTAVRRQVSMKIDSVTPCGSRRAVWSQVMITIYAVTGGRTRTAINRQKIIQLKGKAKQQQVYSLQESNMTMLRI